MRVSNKCLSISVHCSAHHTSYSQSVGILFSMQPVCQCTALPTSILILSNNVPPSLASSSPRPISCTSTLCCGPYLSLSPTNYGPLTWTWRISYVQTMKKVFIYVLSYRNYSFPFFRPCPTPYIFYLTPCLDQCSKNPVLTITWLHLSHSRMTSSSLTFSSTSST